MMLRSGRLGLPAEYAAERQDDDAVGAMLAAQARAGPGEGPADKLRAILERMAEVVPGTREESGAGKRKRMSALKAVLARLDDASSTLTVRCQETSQQVQRLETAQGEAMRHSDRTFRESERQAEAVRADFEGFERRWERRLDEARRRSDESVFQAAFQGLFH